MKSMHIICTILAFLLLQSCSISTDTTYFKNTSSSTETNILMDQTALNMLGMAGTGSPLNSADIKKLSTTWQSFYDIQKDGLINLNQDSVAVLKKFFVKVNKRNNEIYGLSLKYDKLFPGEVTALFRLNKSLQSIPLQNIGNWDGKSLTIDTKNFDTADLIGKLARLENEKTPTVPQNKSDSLEVYGKQMATGMLGLMKMFNMNFNSTLKFQKPIKTITGSHDFVKQLDNRTLQINVRSKELLDNSDRLQNKDRYIIVKTE